MIKKWLERRRRARFRNGYDYAAGVLLRENVEGMKKLLRCTDTAHTFNSFDDFDEGIKQAIDDWRGQYIGFIPAKHPKSGDLGYEYTFPASPFG